MMEYVSRLSIPYFLFFLVLVSFFITPVRAQSDETLDLRIPLQSPVSPQNISARSGKYSPVENDAAWGRPVFASSYYQKGYPSGSVDGNDSTVWRSASSTGTWLYVDLGKAVPVRKIVSTLFVDDQAATAPVTLYIASNDLKKWTVLATETNTKNASNRGMPREFVINSDATYRYVGLYGKDWSDGWADLTRFHVVTDPDKLPEAGVPMGVYLLLGGGILFVAGRFLYSTIRFS